MFHNAGNFPEGLAHGDNIFGSDFKRFAADFHILDGFVGIFLPHFGGYTEWDEAARYLADTNVMVDTSSTFFAVPNERVMQLISLYGEDRILFGTDFPMWRAIPEIQNLLSLGLPETTLKKIFSENLLRFLGEDETICCCG